MDHQINASSSTTTLDVLASLGVDAADLKAVWYAFPMAMFVTPDHFGDELEVTATALRTYDAGDCMADALLNVVNELRMATECTCTFGHESGYQIATILGDICTKKGKPSDLALIRDLAPVMEAQALCDEGKAIARAALQGLELFGPEVEAHITKKTCPAGSCKAYMTYHVLVSRCTGCGKCLKACDDKAIMGKARFVHVIDQRKCSQCGDCLPVCPEKAIVMAGAKKPKTPPRPIPCKRKK